MACLDILGKATQASVYEILGGPTRHKVRAMAVLAGARRELRASVLAAKQEGLRAFSVPLTMPSGMERGRQFYTGIRATLDGLRGAAGEECDFVLDCGGRPSPGEALSIADRLAGFHLLWMDEPCGELSATAQASISKGSAMPAGYGRGFTDVARFQDLLREDAVDVLRPALATHGLTAVRKAAAIAETYYVAVAPFHRGGPDRHRRRSARLRGAAELLRPGEALLHESCRPSVPRRDQRLGREAQRRVLPADRPARPRPRRRRARARRAHGRPLGEEHSP